ncbi:hypothetical protein [Actinoplanes sp. OR16]|uniref:hypothetical protein n=1 Tax=Actinoplanes sp. OR16 TaxID=946334 RepID=UPI000FDC545A|nr:hypothetical protein [Actinoplanes sp. OR16]
MMQLLGGVAVAGVVAAGSTAFTAGGLTGPGTTTFVGGKITNTVTGATLSSIKATTANQTDAATRISAFELTFDSATPVGSVVTLTTDGAAGGTTLPTGYYCQTVQVTTYKSLCTAGTNLATPTGYYTAVGTLTIDVTPA